MSAPALSPPRPGALARAAAIAAGLLAALLLAPALGVALLALAAGAMLGSRPASVWLGPLTWGLTFHIFAVVVLFGLVGLPEELVRVLASWKELLVLLLLATVAVRAASGRVRATSVNPADLAIAGLLALTALHALAIPLGASRHELTGMGVLYGVRDAAYFLALWVVGRATPEIAEDERTMRRLFVVGIVTSLIAVVEKLVVTPEMLVLLGAASYFSDFLNTSAYTVGNEFGLPANYWTAFGGRLVQRTGSVFMSSQGFAIPFLLILPAATLWMTLRRRWRSPMFLLAYALPWTGLLLSVTRMTTVACLLQVLAILLLTRRPAALVSFGAVGTMLFAAMLVLVPGVATFVWSTLTWQTGSSASHARDWANGVAAMWEHPFGAGLGTADQTATRLGLVPITSDNLFLKYGVELGWAGLLLFVLLLAVLAWTGVRMALHDSTPPRRAAGALLAAMALGVAVNGVTAVLFNATMLAYLFFWMAGAATSLHALDVGTRGDVAPR
jgi:hypothetical protein